MSLSVISLIPRLEGLSLNVSFAVACGGSTFAGVTAAGIDDATTACAADGTANGTTGLGKAAGGGVDSEESKDVGRREPVTDEMTEILSEVDAPPPIGARLGGCCPP